MDDVAGILRHSLILAKPIATMNELNISVGTNVAKEAGRHFIDAWHRAERGEVFHERRRGFEGWDTLARILTTERIELLRHIRRGDISSVEELARELRRDFDAVLADIAVLTEGKILTYHDARLKIDFGAIMIRIEL